ncbi:MAG: ATP-binding protein [Acidobacteriota bacterium]|jgi:nitrogen fixation/metabolism regulation signal transduction histidine kinase|nr:ATP-binding protein [Acidobacteriota bacterium]
MNDQPGFQKTPDDLRTRRYVLGAIIFLALALVATHTFLHRTSVGSQRFIGMTWIVYTGTFLALLALLVLATILGRNLIKLYFERRSGRLGSGFKTKLVRTFIGLSLLPALLLFLLAYTLISSSIEKWFRAPTAQMMDKSRILAEQYYAEAEERAKHFAGSIAGHLHSDEGILAGPGEKTTLRLRELATEFAVGAIEVYRSDGRLAATSGPALSPAAHGEIRAHLVRQALQGTPGFGVHRVDPNDPWNEISYATAPITGSEGRTAGAVLTESLHPTSAQTWADVVMDAYQKYGQLEREQSSLRFNILLILVLATLLIVFAFAWFALYLAKRITVPIQALAEGAAEVAAGNLGHRVECQAFDELGSLVTRFNLMTADLEENERRIRAAQENLSRTSLENEARRRYIETILQTIATGVIALDAGGRVRTMNQAALRMLGIAPPGESAPLEEVVAPRVCGALRQLLRKAEVLGTEVKNIELAAPGGTRQLAATATPLVDGDGARAGWVVVLDDMTEFLRMEKIAAWQEVARRLAHEIKNPLTPIQLSAERILKRYRQLAPDDSQGAAGREEFGRFDRLLEEGVKVIIQEAGSLKSLVDEFSRFARLPEVRLEDADLNGILEQTLQIYDDRMQGVEVRREYGEIPTLRLDPEQMKRVFINLFDNALEALARKDESRLPSSAAGVGIDEPRTTACASGLRTGEAPTDLEGLGPDQKPSGTAGSTGGEKILQVRTSWDRVRQRARVEIGDSGGGFPKEYRDSVFLPYFSIRKGGTGLGLAIVRQIVSDHGGEVRAEANRPFGTRIVIDLPLVRD